MIIIVTGKKYDVLQKCTLGEPCPALGRSEVSMRKWIQDWDMKDVQAWHQVNEEEDWRAAQFRRTARAELEVGSKLSLKNWRDISD